MSYTQLLIGPTYSQLTQSPTSYGYEQPIPYTSRSMKHASWSALVVDPLPTPQQSQPQYTKDMIYRYPLTTGQGLLRYISINLKDDLDIDSMFNLFNQHPFLFGFELFFTYVNVDTPIPTPIYFKTSQQPNYKHYQPTLDLNHTQSQGYE